MPFPQFLEAPLPSDISPLIVKISYHSFLVNFLKKGWMGGEGGSKYAGSFICVHSWYSCHDIEQGLRQRCSGFLQWRCDFILFVLLKLFWAQHVFRKSAGHRCFVDKPLWNITQNSYENSSERFLILHSVKFQNCELNHSRHAKNQLRIFTLEKLIVRNLAKFLKKHRS